MLLDQRHEIVTLIGRGGIGKTSLALKVLHDLSSDNRYDLIIWFSARDIELSPNGPKQVRPRAVDVIDLATQYASLISSTTPEDPVNFLARELSGSELGRVLFGFDNFETVTSSRGSIYLDRHPHSTSEQSTHHDSDTASFEEITLSKCVE